MAGNHLSFLSEAVNHAAALLPTGLWVRALGWLHLLFAAVGGAAPLQGARQERFQRCVFGSAEGSHHGYARFPLKHGSALRAEAIPATGLRLCL